MATRVVSGTRRAWLAARVLAGRIGLAMAMTAGLAACGGGKAAGPAPQQAPMDASQLPAAAAAPRKMMPGRIYAPTQGGVTCPSMDFETFLHAFFNSGDLQVRYTAKPVVYKVPYHDYHNTEPGDPANPQWQTYERDRPMHDRYRYDSQLRAYVWDSTRLRAGQRWTGVDASGNHVPHPVTELQLRRLSETEWEVLTPGRITTFTRRPDCWYLTADWSLDPFEGCRWPDECRQLREYEAPYYQDD
ncbi:hypothetical protein [Luteimonas huabeiensis]|uniref:hypothetical protein n=1 Tax=Luteimonas huabeiensis TaxID=1244513 RepID=UPI0012679A3D|nr:hypothetical protein [Luteimonas huabeiensis]